MNAIGRQAANDAHAICGSEGDGTLGEQLCVAVDIDPRPSVPSRGIANWAVKAYFQYEIPTS